MPLIIRLLIWTFILLVSLFSNGNAQYLGVEAEKNEEQFLLWAYNKYPCPITLSATNPSIDTTYESYIPKNGKEVLIRADTTSNDFIEHPRKMLSFKLALGNPNATHNEAYRYNLPFPAGSSYMLTQGTNTPYSHNGAAKYAYDFAMPKGSYVAAARGGIVGFTIEHYKVGENNTSLRDKSNKIMVCHNDGSVAVYGHLKHQGAIVEIGNRVFAGQVIGLSGNTGHIYTLQSK